MSTPAVSSRLCGNTKCGLVRSSLSHPRFRHPFGDPLRPGLDCRLEASSARVDILGCVLAEQLESLRPYGQAVGKGIESANGDEQCSLLQQHFARERALR